MSRSLKVAAEYIKKAKNALKRNGFPSKKALAEETGISRGTISKFLNGKAIDYRNFVEICEKLALDWQEINDLRDPPKPVPDPPVKTKEPPQSPQERCKAKDLAEQMRGWFEALNYSFEEYVVWEENYFEWIINVPGRRRYDRILVRGVAGEASIKDFQALSELVTEHRTDEGWLVALRRVSDAVRREQNKSETKNIYCYTFDELLDDVAQFDGYIQWLTDEIQRRKIDTQYVPLAGTKDDIDPETKQKLGTSKYDEDNGWIEGYIEKWLADNTKEHLSVLGEFGTGKTWFAFHYAWIALQEYLKAKKKGVERPRLPLVIPLRDYAKAVSVESLFSEFFFRKHEIPLPGYSAFEQLNRMGKLLLIFDGFDEMAARIDKQAMIDNFWQLARVVVPGAKAILTCRTEHFPEAKEGRSLLNAELQASVSALTGEPPQFEILELEKLNKEQIEKVLEKREVQKNTIQKVMENQELLDLARRPVMVDLIVEALPEIEEGKPVDISRVYLYAVTRKMNRDTRTGRTFTSLADKLYFLCELSWEMISTNNMSLNYREFPERIRRYFREKIQKAQDEDYWKNDMMGNTILVRNSEGDYSPAHRSFLEFFVAYKFAAELGILAEDFAAIAEIPQFQERVDLADTFGKQPLAKAVQDLILPIIAKGDATKQRLLEIIQNTQGKTEEQAAYIGGNGVNLLLPLQGNFLTHQNLAGTFIKEGNFSKAHLRDVNLTAANLNNCIFAKQAFGVVLAVAWHPQQFIFATGHSDNTVRIWEGFTAREIITIRGHDNYIRSVVWTNDGQALASASSDGIIKIWNPISGKCLQTLGDLRLNTVPIIWMLVRQYNYMAGILFLRKSLIGHDKLVSSVAWNTNGQFLASGSFDKTIKIWDWESGQCLQILTEHNDIINSIAWSSDGQFLASGSSDSTIKIWNSSTGECLHTLKDHKNSVSSVAWSNDGKFLVSGSFDKTIKIWNWESDQCLQTLTGHGKRVNSVAWSSDDQFLASGSFDETIKIWNRESGQCIQTLTGHNGWVNSVSWSNDGQFLASSSHNKIIKIWNRESGQCIETLNDHNQRIYSVAWSSDGQFLATGSGDTTIKIWNQESGECLKILVGHGNKVNSVAWSSNGEFLASGSSDKTIKIWNRESGECLQTLQDHNAVINSVAWSHKGQFLASASFDTTIKIWNPIDKKCLKTLEGHNSWVRSVAWSHNNNFLASSSDDTTIKIWNPDTGRCLKTLEGHNNVVYSVAWSSNGEFLASGSGDTTIKIWNPDTGECLQTLTGHSDEIYSIAWSNDGKFLASGSSDKKIKIWNPKTGKRLYTLEGHNDWLYSVAWTNDKKSNNKSLATGSGDKTIKIWNPESEKCLATWDNRIYAGTNITGATGLTQAQTATLLALGAIDNDQ